MSKRKYFPVVGQKFGSYEVIDAEIRKTAGKSGNTMFHVRCSCGRENFVNAMLLFNGRSSRCEECKNGAPPEIGQRFGRWTVIGLEISLKEVHGRRCKVVCDCGKTSVIRYSLLKSKKTLGCQKCNGGARLKKQKSLGTWKGFEDIPASFMNVLFLSAKKRGIEISISAKDIWEKYVEQDRQCALTGYPLSFRTYNTRGDASVDRIDSGAGYVRGNIQIVHKKINRMKWDESQEDFIGLCRRVVEYADRQDSTAT